MKSALHCLLLAFVFCFVALPTNATTYTILTQDFEFVQEFDTILVGDTVKWVWVNGLHTTTSNGIPDGAQPWSVQLDQFNTSFTYVVEIPGEYNYISVPDAPLMGGRFTVRYPVGVSPVNVSVFNFLVSGNPTEGEIGFSFVLTQAAEVNVTLYHLAGVEVKPLFSGWLAAGWFRHQSALPAGLSPGLYFAVLRTGNSSFTRRVIIQ